MSSGLHWRLTPSQQVFDDNPQRSLGRRANAGRKAVTIAISSGGNCNPQGAEFAAVTERRWVRVRLGVRGRPHQSSLSPPRKRPSPRQTSALLLGLVHNHNPSQQSFAQSLCARSPEIAISVELAKQFRRMMQ